MPTILHSALSNAEAHEPIHITDAVTGDAGKVITPSSSTNGVSELRKLVETEINSVVDVYTVYMADVCTASSAYFTPAYAGHIIEIKSCISGAIATADCVVTGSVGGTAITDGVLTIAFTSSAAGDVDTVTPTAGNVVSTTDYVRLASDGAGTNTVPTVFTVRIRRS